MRGVSVAQLVGFPADTLLCLCNAVLLLLSGIVHVSLEAGTSCGTFKWLLATAQHSKQTIAACSCSSSESPEGNSLTLLVNTVLHSTM
jgi:hypothetical protein